VLTDGGLVARCPIGAGQALLIADADWINDMLWTLLPERPDDRTGWTSDTLDQLTAWLRDEKIRVGAMATWLVDRDSLLSGLRVALGLLLLLAVGDALVARRPIATSAKNETKTDHNWNRKNTRFDTG
jgi:hypothetical protein